MLVQYVKVGIVGGSDQVKICEQLGPNGESPISKFLYCNILTRIYNVQDCRLLVAFTLCMLRLSLRLGVIGKCGDDTQAQIGSKARLLVRSTCGI